MHMKHSCTKKQHTLHNDYDKSWTMFIYQQGPWKYHHIIFWHIAFVSGYFTGNVTFPPRKQPPPPLRFPKNIPVFSGGCLRPTLRPISSTERTGGGKIFGRNFPKNFPSLQSACFWVCFWLTWDIHGYPGWWDSGSWYGELPSGCKLFS